MASGSGGRPLSGPRLTDIAVLGAGSIGCFVGGCWQVAGLDVQLIGRPRLGSELAEHGLTLTDSLGWSSKLSPAQLRFATGPEALAGSDIILLCVKSADTASAAEQIADHGQPGATIISLQNGISNVALLERRLGGRFKIRRGTVPYNVAHLGNGQFHKGVAGTIMVASDPALKVLARRVEGGPAALAMAPDMLAIAWGKLLINLNNAVNALSGLPLVEQLGQRGYRQVVAASVREGLTILAAAGIRPARAGPVPPALLPAVLESPDWLFRQLFLRLQKIDSRARSSMADDLAAGRPTEIDYLNGELVRLAEQLGRDAPTNRHVVALVRRAEQGAQPWPAAALKEAVLGGGG